jgi:hypothetical protein
MDRLQGDGVDLDIAIPGTKLHAELAVAGGSAGNKDLDEYQGLQFGGRVWGEVVDNVALVASYRFLREASTTTQPDSLANNESVIAAFSNYDLLNTLLSASNLTNGNPNQTRNNIGVYGKFGLLDNKLSVLAGYGVTFVSLDGFQDSYTSSTTTYTGIKYTNNFHGIDLRLGYQLTDKITIASDHNISFGAYGLDYTVGSVDTTVKFDTFVYFGSLLASIGLSDKLSANVMFRETASSVTNTVKSSSAAASSETVNKNGYNEIKIDVGLGYAVSKNASVSAGVELEFDTYTTEVVKVPSGGKTGISSQTDVWTFGIPLGITVKF